MVCAVHHKLNAFCYRAKLADDQLVANKREMIKDVTLEVFRVFRIVVVGIITHDDVGIGYRVFDKTNLRESSIGCAVDGFGPFIRLLKARRTECSARLLCLFLIQIHLINRKADLIGADFGHRILRFLFDKRRRFIGR